MTDAPQDPSTNPNQSEFPPPPPPQPALPTPPPPAPALAPYTGAQNTFPPQPGYPPQVQKNGMYTAAAIINWVYLGIVVVSTCGLGIIAAAWFVPMTLNIQKGAVDGRRHTALAICTLLFCNIISGILMLVEDSNRPD